MSASLAFLDTWLNREDFWLQTGWFLSMAFRGLGLALLISLPLGVLLSRFPRVATPVISALAVIQTVPGLALLGFCISLLGIVAASMIYVAVADLIPGLHRRPELRDTASQAVLIGLGIATIALVRALVVSH